MDQSLQSPFFVSVRKRRCAHRTLDGTDGTFRMLTRELGLMSAYGREPRLHDLRHTWATRCLAKLYETGKDPNAELPIIATYLGHVNIACTTIYLHPTADLLAQAGDRFQRYVTAPETRATGGQHDESKALLPLLQSFFQEYLAGQRGVSNNTILAYRDALKLFLFFLAGSTGKQAARLQMDDLQAERVPAFLDDTEQKRKNRTVTRNLRLTANSRIRGHLPDRPVRSIESRIAWTS